MTVDFSVWAAEEALRTERAELLRPLQPEQKPARWRPTLPADLGDRYARLASVQGMTRNDLVAHALERWAASWRPL